MCTALTHRLFCRPHRRKIVDVHSDVMAMLLSYIQSMASMYCLVLPAYECLMSSASLQVFIIGWRNPLPSFMELLPDAEGFWHDPCWSKHAFIEPTAFGGKPLYRQLQSMTEIACTLCKPESSFQTCRALGEHLKTDHQQRLCLLCLKVRHAFSGYTLHNLVPVGSSAWNTVIANPRSCVSPLTATFKQRPVVCPLTSHASHAD